MKVTDSQRELMVDYLGFLKKGAYFTQNWARWKRVHDELMRSVTYDYQLFRTEAELWDKVQEDIDAMRLHRQGKNYVERRN